MKIKELITKLSKYNPNVVVKIALNDEYCDDISEIKIDEDGELIISD